MAAKRRLSDAKEKQVAAAYAKGKSSTELMERFGVSGDTIRAAVIRQGGSLRPRGGIAGKRRKAA